MNRASIIAMLLLAGCSSSQEHTVPASPDTPLVIVNDGGGNVAAYVRLRAELAASGNPVELRGYIASAATILMSLPNACIGSGSTWGFHASTSVDVPLIGQVADAGIDALIGSFYRNGIKDRWDAEWSRSDAIVRLTAAEVVALDPQLKFCDEKD